MSVYIVCTEQTFKEQHAMEGLQTCSKNKKYTSNAQEQNWNKQDIRKSAVLILNVDLINH